MSMGPSDHDAKAGTAPRAGDPLNPRAMAPPPAVVVEADVAAALAEDLGDGDATAALLPDVADSAYLLCKEDAVVCGRAWFDACHRALDPDVRIDWRVTEGDHVRKGTVLATLQGRARSLVSAERASLNFLQTLSGTATVTARYVEAVRGTRAHILDTRKTIPGLRHLEKYATRMGGAQNHRMGLWDAAMIKDNHVLVAGGVAEAVRRARAAGVTRIICEVDRIDQIEPALAAGAHHLLLDNMTTAELRDAVALVAGRVPCEASGGVRLDTIGAIAATGVDYVSVGRLTQSAPAADIGLDFTPL